MNMETLFVWAFQPFAEYFKDKWCSSPGTAFASLVRAAITASTSLADLRRHNCIDKPRRSASTHCHRIHLERQRRQEVKSPRQAASATGILGLRLNRRRRHHRIPASSILLHTCEHSSGCEGVVVLLQPCEHPHLSSHSSLSVSIPLFSHICLHKPLASLLDLDGYIILFCLFARVKYDSIQHETYAIFH
jgi:hypothetical protein